MSMSLEVDGSNRSCMSKTLNQKGTRLGGSTIDAWYGRGREGGREVHTILSKGGQLRSMYAHTSSKNCFGRKIKIVLPDEYGHDLSIKETMWQRKK